MSTYKYVGVYDGTLVKGFDYRQEKDIAGNECDYMLTECGWIEVTDVMTLESLTHWVSKD